MDETRGAEGETASLLETSLALDGDGSRIAQARHLAAAFLTKVRDDHGFPLVTATVEIVERTPLGKRITADIALIPATA